MRKTTRFRQLIEGDPLLVLPGIFDALSGRLAEEAGFEALAAGSYAASASMIGAPGPGQLGMKEMADFYARLCDATNLPLLAEAESSHGEPVAIARTMREYEKAGIAALILEDQATPRRHGYMEEKRVIGVREMIAKIKAALDARQDQDLMLIARTDARAIEGFEAAIDRSHLYREAGADMILVDSPLSSEEMNHICSSIAAPCLAINIEGGKAPILTPGQLQDIGYAAVALPLSALYAAAGALRRFYTALREANDAGILLDDSMTPSAFSDLVRLPLLREKERAADAFARDLLERVARPAEDD